jgi:RHH-type proline utilization regulon transcriptional repressor/proline dehydrogenase/delta 1-pyrroline-5-carboxylate dehydrogenase
MGKSSFGPGIKAGGPNYVAPLMRFRDDPSKRAGSSPTPALNLPAPSPFVERVGERGGEAIGRPLPHVASPLGPIRQGEGDQWNQLRSLRDAVAKLDPKAPIPGDDRSRLTTAIDSYLYWMNEEFASAHDPFRLIGEDNFRRYLPVTPIRIRVHEADAPFEIFARAAAAHAAGCRTVVSSPPSLPGSARDAVRLLDSLTDSWAAAIEFVEETDDQLAAAIRHHLTSRVRYAHPDRVPELVRRASAEAFSYIADAPVLAQGRVELLWYFQEQSLSHVYHRYGNLGRRASEERAPITL